VAACSIPSGDADNLPAPETIARSSRTPPPRSLSSRRSTCITISGSGCCLGRLSGNTSSAPPTSKGARGERCCPPRVPLSARPLGFIPASVALAGGTGLRWGECVGLRWEYLDLDERTVRVVRVAVEIAGTVTTKPYPKSRAGRRTVPLPDFAADLLTAHKEAFPAGPAGEVFTNTSGGPLRRTLFRSRVWRPALARAGLLGRTDRLGHFKFRAVWRDSEGIEWSKEFTTEREAVANVAKVASKRSALPRPPALLRHVARVARRAGQRREGGDGARADLDHVEPLHARLRGPHEACPGRVR